MELAQLVAVVSATTIGILTFIGAIVGWIIKTWWAGQLAPIKADLAAIKREVMPNGGESLADRVVRIEAKIDGQDKRERE